MCSFIYYMYAQTCIRYAQNTSSTAQNGLRFAQNLGRYAQRHLVFAQSRIFLLKKFLLNRILNSISHKKMTPKVEIHAFGSFIDKKLKFFYLFTCFSSHSRCFCLVNGSKRMFRWRIDRVDF
jgi:hypothetical protein